MVQIGDRVQADCESKTLDARLRLDFLFDNSDAASFVIAPSGFIQWKPLAQFKLFAGNDCYKNFAIDSAYLAAADDTTKYGRLLTDSLGYEKYLGANSSDSTDDDADESLHGSGAFLYLNGFCGGISSDWTFGQNNSIYLSVTLELPSKLGSITTGVHLDMNQTRYKGLSDICIPLSYSYKFKKKF